MKTLEQAAQQALENICGAKLCEVNSMSSRAEMLRLMDAAITALREALAQRKQQDHIHDATKMVGCAYCDNPLFAGTKCNNCGRITLAEPVKQEPVAWMDLHKELGKLRWMGGDEGWDNAINAVRDRLIELATPRPVRTKDLTDDEIEEIGKSYFDEWSFGFARAVIAADREKNK